MVLIGILGEVSATGLATGTALGAISAGMSARAILNEQMVDSVYENALKWIVQVSGVILSCAVYVNPNQNTLTIFKMKSVCII